MNRLLQGDVGSGKTVVAVYAMLLAVAHRHQAVLMAPTEVLARQHAADARAGCWPAARSAVRCLTGGLTAAAAAAAAGRRSPPARCDLVVGTQAVVQEDVRVRASSGWW